jgi:hypothetical protein
VATFVPAQADFPLVLPTKIAFGVRKILINGRRSKDLRVRNALTYVSVSTQCLTRFVPDGMFNVSARKWKSRCGSVADGTYKTIVHFKLDN